MEMKSFLQLYLPHRAPAARNQLLGSYLREAKAGCCIFLLVWQGAGASKRWRIWNKTVALGQLGEALKQYWLSNSKNYPNVSDIEIVVIDLTKQADVSASLVCFRQY